MRNNKEPEQLSRDLLIPHVSKGAARSLRWAFRKSKITSHLPPPPATDISDLADLDFSHSARGSVTS
jgi:hypothetical protein